MNETIVKKIKSPEAIENPADICLGDRPVIIVKRSVGDGERTVEILKEAAELGVIVLIVPWNADIERIL